MSLCSDHRAVAGVLTGSQRYQYCESGHDDLVPSALAGRPGQRNDVQVSH